MLGLAIISPQVLIRYFTSKGNSQLEFLFDLSWGLGLHLPEVINLGLNIDLSVSFRPRPNQDTTPTYAQREMDVMNGYAGKFTPSNQILALGALQCKFIAILLLCIANLLQFSLHPSCSLGTWIRPIKFK